MALSDFWQIKDNQAFQGKPVLNVYHVQRILAGANALSVAEAIRDTIINGPLNFIQVAGLTRSTIDVENLGDPTDFISLDSSAFAGTRAGEAQPSFAGATIQFSRTRTDMKNGAKRYLCGNETDALNGVWDATFLALLATLGTALVTPWERTAAPGIDVCQLVILKRFCVDPLQDPCQVYRLPDASEIDSSFYNPFNAIVRNRLRSQVSRKVLN